MDAPVLVSDLPLKSLDKLALTSPHGLESVVVVIGLGLGLSRQCCRLWWAHRCSAQSTADKEVPDEHHHERDEEEVPRKVQGNHTEVAEVHHVVVVHGRALGLGDTAESKDH